MPISPKSPIILVDDDVDDIYFISEALKAVAPSHPVLSFTDAESVLTHFKTNKEKPFLILSEIKLPGISGIELRQAIEDDPLTRKRSIPFLFMSNPAIDSVVDKAYDLTIQGFFEKPHRNEDLKAILKAVTDYWSFCVPPRL